MFSSIAIAVSTSGMQKLITPTDYLEHTGPPLGTLPPRTAPDGLPALDLGGCWGFSWSADSTDLPEGFEAGRGEAAATIDVPSHWQLQGWGRPQYTNSQYPFPLDVPHVPFENEVGSYRRLFEVPQAWRSSGRVLLRFEGVDSTAVVWVNGVQLGLLVGSRLTHEFDVTEHLKAGENLIAVRVHQWSASSYIEDQDQWWLSGIFREVSLRHLPTGVPSDVRVDTDWADGAGSITVTADVPGRFEISELGFTGELGEPVTIQGVLPWSAESPQLYDVTVYGPSGAVHVRTGFRSVSVSDGVFRVNGARTVLRGVNRHDFHPLRGRALTRQDMLDDVLAIKRANLNALRTSHYPPPPYLLQLCDQYGLYVIDECDLETHGFIDVDPEGNPVDDPRWTQALVSRMGSMVTRDRNHPCIVMWSLGNEADTGFNLAAMAAWTKSADPSRPIQYECDRETAYTDVWSQMYTPHQELAAIAQRAEPALPDLAQDARRRAKPYLLCEYGHAMGNGPGGLLEYRDLIESSQRCAGAFVWELIDQGLTTTDAAGNTIVGYGGDLGEVLHSGNFCCDGLLFADRSPSPGMAQVAAVNAPIRLAFGTDSIVISSAYDHTGTANLSYRWTLTDNGIEVDAGELPVPVLGPGDQADVRFPEIPRGADSGELVFTVSVQLAAEAAWAPAGHEIAFAQHVVSAGPARVQLRSPAVAATVFQQDGPDRDSSLERIVSVGPARIDRYTGMLVELGGVTLVGPRLELWRAPTDNDRGPDEATAVASAWSRLGLHRLTHRLTHLDVTGPAVTAVIRTAAAHRRDAVVTTYRWSSDGHQALCEITVEPVGDWTVPVGRIGWVLELPPEHDAVAWYGGGPGEAYSDSRAASRLGRYETTVPSLHTPYARPQENGQRLDVRWAQVGPLRITGDRPFGLTVSPYSRRQLAETAHNAALRPEDRLFCHIDLAQHGLGSASCGPGPLPEDVLLLTPQTFTLAMEVAP